MKLKNWRHSKARGRNRSDYTISTRGDWVRSLSEPGAEGNEQRGSVETGEMLFVLDQLVDSVEQALVVVDRNGDVVRANPAAADLMESGESSLTGRPFSECCSGYGLPVTPLELKCLSANGQLKSVRGDVRTAVGTLVPASFSFDLIFDRAGNIAGMTAMIEDIRRHQALIDELARRHSQHREQIMRQHILALKEISRSQVWESRGLGDAFRQINEISARALGVERGSIWLFNEKHIRLTCQDLYETSDNYHSGSEDLSAKEYPFFFAAIEDGCTIAAADVHHDSRTHEFSEIYWQMFGIGSMLAAPIMVWGRIVGVVCHEHVGPMRHWTPEEEVFAGSVADFIAMAIEAVERGKAQSSQARLAAILEATPDFVGIGNPRGELLFVNEAGRKMVGLPNLTGTPAVTARHYQPDWACALLEKEAIPSALRNGIWAGETALKGAGGREIPVSQLIIAHRNAGGELEFLSTVMRDITDRKRIEEERARLLLREREARHVAEEANRLKDDFLAVVSHELRAPLTSILGWTEILQAGGLDDLTAKRALQTIERSVKTQVHLVGDLLDASRIATGKMQLELRSVDLRGIVETVVDSVRPMLKEKRLRLQMILEPWVSPFLGDPERLKQIVWNLLANAIKFTPAGGLIEIRLERLEDKALLIVSDTGQGINSEFLPHLFERFRQADGTSSRATGGLGLGLAIVKHLVELHNGAIYAYSRGEGQGTDMMVTLPLAVNEPLLVEASLSQTQKREPKSAVRKASLRGVHVLVVDDEYDTREVLGVMLSRYGADVRMAGATAEAIEMLASWRPDVLVSDIAMPGEDGYALIRKLRAMPAEQGGLIPAIALTSFAGIQDRSRALSTGFQIHLAKPIEPAELARVVARVTGGNDLSIA
ncbi:MAG: ATP-binding protein [Blastocatellia bacterium]